MTISKITAISPLDGRYADRVDSLRPLFSEFALMRFRVLVEIRWLQHLANLSEIPEITPFSVHANNILNNIADNFSEQDALRIKNIEQSINHDVKAIEYFLKEKVNGNPELEKVSEFIHFACTSEDINNLSYALMLKAARQQILLPLMDEIISVLSNLAHSYANQAMLGHTHGQPATPTTMGKEIAIFVTRLRRQRAEFINCSILGKMNGAVGNYNAHRITYPEINWLSVSQKFVTSFDLEWNSHTTQIESHDFIASYCHAITRFNTILIDLNRDLWSYISLNYFKQKMLTTEVGSSTMPHKVNPIDFENSEGNLSIANALLTFLASRLPVSRWQRDLVDSTLLRNLGVTIAHTTVGYQSIIKGLNKLELNATVLDDELNKHWEVLTEAIQTVMRRFNVENPYEQLKDLSRGKRIDETKLKEFITSLNLPAQVKENLLNMTPQDYIGYAKELAKEV